MKKINLLLLAVTLVAASTQAACVTASASKPTDAVVAQSIPGRDLLLAFESEERIKAGRGGERYAWGQSFTVPVGNAWEVDAISVQYHGDSMAHSDATIKLILFDYDAATFLGEDWGSYTDPLKGMATASRYTEIFSFPTSYNEGDWITFDLSNDQSLPAGTYGFALWLSSPTAGTLALKHGAIYEGGGRLRIEKKSGNTAPFSNFNFVIQGDVDTDVPVDVGFATIFASGCVLQREQTVPVWGRATQGDTITVEIKGQSKQGVADDLGFWRVELDPESAGGPYTLTAAGTAGDAAELTQVYVGDVWLFTGQSNMEQPLIRQITKFASDYPKVPNASDDVDDMRFAIVEAVTTRAPADNVRFSTSWSRWQRESLNDLSAVGYFFARTLNEHMDANGMANVPLGFISVSKGGTSIEEWIPEYQLNAAQVAHNSQLKLRFKASPGGFYNGMIAPLKDYGVKGAIWYQGESNTRPNGMVRIPQYPILNEVLLLSWREQFKKPDMPFYFVQLAAHQAYRPSPKNELWAWMREMQASCLQFPHTAMACFIDGGHQKEIHPPGKDRVGERLARIALDQTYGISMVHRGPTLQEMSIHGSAATLTFDHVASGLETRAVDSQPDADEIAEGLRAVSVSADELAGFFLCGADQKFYPAREATITASNQVRISNTVDVPSPVAVRYAFQDYPRCNLFNSEGLPAEPFRTDDYAFGKRKSK